MPTGRETAPAIPNYIWLAHKKITHVEERDLSKEENDEKPVPAKKVKTKADKQAEHIDRIKRTLIASLIGIGAGALSFYLGGTPDAAGLQKSGFLGFMLMLAGIVIQKHLFRLMGMDTAKLGGKDWFYQGFMTFAFWLLTWTILLTSFSQ